MNASLSYKTVSCATSGQPRRPKQRTEIYLARRNKCKLWEKNWSLSSESKINVLLIELCYVINGLLGISHLLVISFRNISLIMRHHEALADINRHLKERNQKIVQEVHTLVERNAVRDFFFNFMPHLLYIDNRHADKNDWTSTTAWKQCHGEVILYSCLATTHLSVSHSSLLVLCKFSSIAEGKIGNYWAHLCIPTSSLTHTHTDILDPDSHTWEAAWRQNSKEPQSRERVGEKVLCLPRKSKYFSFCGSLRNTER